jgi:hypothetical protein
LSKVFVKSWTLSFCVKSSCYFQSPASFDFFLASLIFLFAELGSIFNAQTGKLFLPEISTESETQCWKKNA